MTVAETIRARLEAEISPIELDIVDESHLHSGHAGARPEGETHFRVTAVSDKFTGTTRVERQRLVYGVLSDLIEGPIHALSLKLSAPNESDGKI